MTDRFLELAPLAALEALDGDELREFRAHAPGCAECRSELAAHEAVAARLGTAAAPVAPPAGLKRRTLAAAGVGGDRRSWAWVPATLAAGLAVLAFTTHLDRNEARRALEDARGEAARAEAGAATVRARLAERESLIALLTHRETRLTLLAAAPQGAEPTGRVLWNPRSRRAVLMADGLPPAPPGKAYEVWVIAAGAPRAAGLFRPDADGRALFPLPDVPETAQARTFAVTLEPEAGVPAPTGPMVLAGAVS
ncbi:MAG TPA: anti-sigma factor [Vicinamibacteria bacterium]|jgi:anti-sigma-K factor RskA